MGARWPPDDVLALAPDAASAAMARGLALPGRWSSLGADDTSLWGRCQGGGGEPYETVVDHVRPAFHCSCPSRKHPCKHALGLLLLWAAGHVPQAVAPGHVTAWRARLPAVAHEPSSTPRQGSESRAPASSDPSPERGADTPAPPGPPGPPGPFDRRAAERTARVAAGLAELDRWIADRLRTGLADPALAQYATWDTVAARLVDAQAPSLANRVRRLAGMVGTRPGWHEHVLAELGVLHELARAGGHLADLPPDLADGVRTAIGWTMRQADVLAGPPVTDTWRSAGRSDTLEDRIVVRRRWLQGDRTGRWALVLGFAAYGQGLDDPFPTGTSWTGDLHFYPSSIRALPGPLTTPPTLDPHPPAATTVAGACDALGRALGAEPWLERHPVTIRAAPAPTGGGVWVLTDHTGALAVAGPVPAVVVACSGGEPVVVTGEWTAEGLVPLTVHLDGRAVDVGPRGGWDTPRRGPGRSA